MLKSEIENVWIGILMVVGFNRGNLSYYCQSFAGIPIDAGFVFVIIRKEIVHNENIFTGVTNV